MKKINSALSILLALLLTLSCLTLAACQRPEPTPEDELWKNAFYTEDTELGSGSKTVYVEVKTENKSVTFTIHTDKENLADALLEHSLVGGDNSQFGLYIKKLNGITADYDVDQTYWALTKSGEKLNYGASSASVSDGDHYEFTRTIS